MLSSTAILLLSVLSLAHAQARLSFTDVTSSIGITQPKNPDQWGGPCIADLDGDGHYDLILSYHNTDPLRIWYGSASGRFTPSPFTVGGDLHGVSVAPRTAFSKERLLSISPGGGRGANLRPPYLFLTGPSRRFTNVTNQLGFGKARSRGRVAVFMDLARRSRKQSLRDGGGPDVLFINLLGGRSGGLRHFAYENTRGRYALRRPRNVEFVNEERAIVTDVDGDGVMELVHFSVFRIFRLVAPFTFRDVTAAVAPERMSRLFRTVSAVVELDFDNDGRMDLYVSRADSAVVTPRGPASVPERDDVLLRNVGGRYEDVTERMGVPRGTDSMGVSAGDFDNDGWTDVIVTTFRGRDFVLLNEGGRRFRKVELPVGRERNERGHNVMAVDLDLDGRVDYVVAPGFRGLFRGAYRMMRSRLQLGKGRNFLLVRVGYEPGRAVTMVNAVVSVVVGGKRMTRRVGGRGAQSGGMSLLDTVHFGLGTARRAESVEVRWTSGFVQRRTAVAANRKIEFGVW